METIRDLDLVRVVAGSTALRAASQDDEDQAAGLGRLVVRFSPFDVWYEVNSWWEGHFLERTVKGSFTKTMKEQRDNVRCLFDHGFDFSIGNKVLAGVDDLREDPDAAVLEGDLFDTTYNRDLLPGLKAGAYGSSFRFRVIQEQWNDDPGVSDHNPKGIPERSLTEVRLFEAGPVTFPANPSATAGVRSMTDAYYERLRSREPHLYDALAERVRSIRTPGQVAAAASTASAQGAAQHGQGEPARSHSTRTDQRRRREVLYPFLTGAQR